MITIIVHIAGTEAIKAEVEEIPDPSHTSIVCKNPRERTDKELTWVDEGVTTVIIPWWRINYIQVLTSEDEDTDFVLPFRND
jgi:hypothetical protein